MTKYEKYIMQFAVTKNIVYGIKLDSRQYIIYNSSRIDIYIYIWYDIWTMTKR